MIFLDTRGKSCLLVRLVIIKSFRDLAKNRDKFRFLVELEVFVNVPVDLNGYKSCDGSEPCVESRTMDSQGRDSEQRPVNPD